MRELMIIPNISNIKEYLQLSREYGLGFEYNDFFYPQVLDDLNKQETIINEYLSYDLPRINTMHGAFFDVLIFSDDKYIRQVSEMRVRQSLEIARKMKVSAVIFHTNHNPAFDFFSYLENWHTRNCDYWSRILEEYSDINIYLENMCDSSPDMLVKLAKELECFKNFGVCLDYSHAEIFGGGVRNWVEKVAPYVKHLHINDNDLKSDLHLAVGDGKMSWEDFMKDCETYFSDCTVLIEVTGLEGQKRSIEYLKKMGMLK